MPGSSVFIVTAITPVDYPQIAALIPSIVASGFLIATTARFLVVRQLHAVVTASPIIGY